MKKVILIIRDGWGYRKEKVKNAIAETKTPYTDKLMKEYPNTLIHASGEYVGLPEGYQGNSEVGHMTIGSGRIFYQSLAKINKLIETKEFFNIKEFLDAINNCKKYKTHLHIIGLIQTEGVHSHIEHLFALLKLCKQENFKEVYIHALTDGRDSPPTDSIKNLNSVLDKIKEFGLGKIMTISGRYYAMDRDKRWERTKKAYDCIVKGISPESFDDSITAIKNSHKNNITDEFIVPIKEKSYTGINDNDSIIFFNYRTDRTRQLTQAIVEKDFNGFERQQLKVFYVAMTQYYNPMNAKVAIKDESSNNLLGEVIADNNLKQLRISETEKYAHVTFFFNGQKEEPNKNESRILIPSPKVATYDLKPEMSVYEIKDKLVEEINKNDYSLIVTNLVNGDMVGHTGNIPAIKKAISAVDECLGKIVEAGLKNDYTILVFADHGNAEDQTEKWITSHTLNPVPLILISNDKTLKNSKLKKDKGLQDIAPTVLEILGIQKPKEMTGESIINK